MPTLGRCGRPVCSRHQETESTSYWRSADCVGRNPACRITGVFMCRSGLHQRVALVSQRSAWLTTITSSRRVRRLVGPTWNYAPVFLLWRVGLNFVPSQPATTKARHPTPQPPPNLRHKCFRQHPLLPPSSCPRSQGGKVRRVQPNP